MDTFFENAAQIINAAAQNPLGALSLILLILAFLGVIFFVKGSLRTRMTVFLIIAIVDFILFIFAVIHSVNDSSRLSNNRSKQKPNGTPLEPIEISSLPPIDWGNLEQYFQISKKKKLRNQNLSDLQIGYDPRPVDVLTFIVEAKVNHRCSYFQGVFYDSERIEFPSPYSPQVFFKPHYASWEGGKRSRAYLILPNKITKIEIKSPYYLSC